VVRCLAVVTLAGCSFVSAHATGDAATPEGPQDTTGMEQVQRTCWPQWHDHSIRFTAPVELPNIGSANTTDRDPSLSYDELTMYFSSIRGIRGDADIYKSTRLDTSSAFGAPALVDSLSIDAFDDTRMAITKDDLHVVFSTNRPTSVGLDLWQASRATATDQFSAIVHTGFPMIDDGHDQFDPMLSDDGLTLYYSPFIDAQTKQVISMATRASITADFGAPTVVINSTEGDADPYLSPDQLVLLFSSTRSGGQGLVDVYYTVRDHAGDAWGEVSPILGINTVANEGDPVPSRDGCTLILSSDRDKAVDTFGLYAATSMP
jgi:hypothetical protein